MRRFVEEARTHRALLRVSATAPSPRFVETPTHALVALEQHLIPAVRHQGVQVVICGDVESLVDDQDAILEFGDDEEDADLRDDEVLDQDQVMLSKTSRTLKMWAMRYRVSIITTFELSARRAGCSVFFARLGDLGADGSWESDADLVIFLTGTGSQRLIEVAKHRHGPTGSFPLAFDPAVRLFQEWAP